MTTTSSAKPPDDADEPSSSSSSTTTSLTRRVTENIRTQARRHMVDEEESSLRRQRSTRGLAVTSGERAGELECETWDAATTPFWQHCLAGSLAGVVEHLLMYPVDTLKTHLQTGGGGGGGGTTATTIAAVEDASSSSLSRFWHTTTAAGGGGGGIRWWWRGAQAMAVGCVPAHAAQFGTYELCKATALERQQQQNPNDDGATTLGPWGSTVAGATAALSHDIIMVPADTVKQRLQLGYYAGLRDALARILHTEGPAALWRALPVTLCTNVPYGAVMVTTNETLRRWLLTASASTGNDVHENDDDDDDDDDDGEELTVPITLAAGSGAGMVAAAVTAPLDRCKTFLQTQGLTTVVNRRAHDDATAASPAVRYRGLGQAWRSIVRTEGYRGLLRGAVPRVVTHTPSVAISWTVYEYVKGWLADQTTASSW